MKNNCGAIFLAIMRFGRIFRGVRIADEDLRATGIPKLLNFITTCADLRSSVSFFMMDVAPQNIKPGKNFLAEQVTNGLLGTYFRAFVVGDRCPAGRRRVLSGGCKPTSRERRCSDGHTLDR